MAINDNDVSNNEGPINSADGQDGRNAITDPVSSRRRFVKSAAIAAPAIMTLRGGQALAQTSFSLTACRAERSHMGQVAQNAMGEKLYFVVDEGPNGISVRAASKDDFGAQTVTASCMASLI